MSVQYRKSVTLIELLIAMSLLAVMVLGINSIDVFSHFHLFSTERRARLQNDVSLCLAHMTKYLSSAIGNELINGNNTAVFISPNSTNTSILSGFVDTNANGVRDIGSDSWSGYIFDSNAHTLTYYSRCANASCSISAGTTEVLSNKITAFSAAKDFSKGPYIDVSLTACWNPNSTTAACGSSDNPSFTMATTLALPSVASH